jgi:hypothetical protein
VDSHRPERDRDDVSVESPPVTKRGLLFLADISGYTAFFQAVADAHGEEMAAAAELPPAYPLVTTLLNGIVERMVPPFTLSKLEGDAVFAYSDDQTFSLRGNAVLDCMRKCYEAYRDRRDAADRLMRCRCAACSLLATLELKFVLHRGDYVVQSIAGREELLAPDVTLAHLLLKNRVKEVIGWTAYALLTEKATDYLDVPLEAAVPHTERYEHYPSIQTYVWEL